MATLNFPTLSRPPSSFRMQLKPNTQIFRSPLNGGVQTVELPGAMWICDVVYNTLPQADRLLMQGFLAQLRGRSGRAFLWDMSLQTPNGVATGTPLVNGAGQTGASLITNGWTVSITNILKIGDYFGVNGELKRVVANANSDGTGVSTLVFEPPLRASPANAAVITIASPKFTGLLVDDDQDQYTASTRVQTLEDGGFSVKFQEAFS